MAKCYTVDKIKNDINKLNTEIRENEKKLKVTYPGTLDYQIIGCTLQNLYERKSGLIHVLELVNKLISLREKRAKAYDAYTAYVNRHRGTGNEDICAKVSNMEDTIGLLDNDIIAIESQLANLCCTYEYDISR